MWSSGKIGQLVQTRREALGLSQARLALLAGLSRATINPLENGSLVDLGAAKLLALIVASVAEVAERTQTSPKTLWKHLAAWAQALQSPRAA